MSNAELRRRLNESCLRLSDGRESLIEIGRYLTEVPAFGLRHQSQGDTGLMYVRHRLRHFRLRNREGGLPSIMLLLGYDPRRQQLLRARKFKLCELKCGLAFIESGNTSATGGPLGCRRPQWRFPIARTGS